MIRPETVPLLVVALLLIAAQPGVETVTTVFGGDQELGAEADAVVLVDGRLTVPAETEVGTSLYVIGGTARIEGTLDGPLVQLAGVVSAGSGAEVTGRYQRFGGTDAIAEGAAVEPEVVAEPVTREPSPGQAAISLVLQVLVLGAVSYGLGRRYPDLLANVGHAVSHHPVVCGTVGLLASVTLLALLVFMAFTIVLIPVSLLGLLGGVVVTTYAAVAVGSLVGRWLPIDRPGVATATGAVAFLLASRVVGLVPVVGPSLPVVVLVVGLGAVFITYFGLREFQPPSLGPVQ